jgi:signal transduction histidine kinase
VTAPAVFDRTELEQVATVMEHLSTGVIVFTRELEITFTNPAAQRLVQPARAERGDRLPDPWPSFSLRTYARRLFGPGEVPGVEIDTGERLCRISGITAAGMHSAALVLEEVTVPERRRRAEREFVANAAHELLTPLTGIVAAAHVLEAGAKEVPQDRDQFIAHIARECTRLAAIARALLVLARAQSGEQPPRLDIVPLGPILQEAVEVAGFPPGAARIDCAEDVTVFADPDLLAQAFSNLLANALRHGAGGLVNVAVETARGGKLSIVVSNEGSGYADDIGTQRRFQSAEDPVSDGFGLGISIARQSLEVLGGTLTYEVDGETLHAVVELPAGVIDS